MVSDDGDAAHGDIHDGNVHDNAHNDDRDSICDNACVDDDNYCEKQTSNAKVMQLMTNLNQLPLWRMKQILR